MEYNFPKPRFGAPPERKVSYLLAAEGTPYVVGAGLYDVKADLGELAVLSGGRP